MSKKIPKTFRELIYILYIMATFAVFSLMLENSVHFSKPVLLFIVKIMMAFGFCILFFPLL